MPHVILRQQVRASNDHVPNRLKQERGSGIEHMIILAHVKEREREREKRGEVGQRGGAHMLALQATSNNL